MNKKQALEIIKEWEGGGGFRNTQLSAARKADVYHLEKLYLAFPDLVCAILTDRGIPYKACIGKIFIQT